MARMYSRKKGKHGSKKPPIKSPPRWVGYKKAEVEKLVVQLAKEGKSAAVIGSVLKDRFGIPDVKLITGKTVMKILTENKLQPKMPDDLLNLLKQSVNLHEHMEKYKADKLSKKGLENLESKIRRLAKYYSRKGLIEKDWKYDPEKAKLIIQQK